METISLKRQNGTTRTIERPRCIYDYESLADLRKFVERQPDTIRFQGISRCGCIIGRFGCEIYGEGNFEANEDTADINFSRVADIEDEFIEVPMLNWQEYISRKANMLGNLSKQQALNIIATAEAAIKTDDFWSYIDSVEVEVLHMSGCKFSALRERSDGLNL